MQAAGRVHGGTLGVCHDFSAPLNPLGPPPWLGEVVEECLARRSHLRYPHWAYWELREAIASHRGVEPWQVVVTAGAAEALTLLPLALHAERLVVIEPTFGDHSLYSSAAGLRLERLLLRWSWDGWCSLPPLGRDAFRGSMVLLSRPDNPLSCSVERGEVEEAAAEAAAVGGYLVVDEAYVDVSLTEPLEPGEGLVLVGSLTKMFASPGLRAGYIIVGDRGLAGRLDGVRQPWPVGGLAACTYTSLLLEERSRWYLSRARLLVAEEGVKLCNSLRRLGLECARPVAPYILMRHKTPNPLFAETLAARGACVRDASSFHGLGPSFSRVSIRTHGENDALLKALAGVARSGLA